MPQGRIVKNFWFEMSLLTFLSSFLQFKISSVLQNIKYKFATVRSL